MNLTKKVAFTLVELFESPDDSLTRMAGGSPLLMVGSCSCCCSDVIVVDAPVTDE